MTNLFGLVFVFSDYSLLTTKQSVGACDSKTRGELTAHIWIRNAKHDPPAGEVSSKTNSKNVAFSVALSKNVFAASKPFF